MAEVILNRVTKVYDGNITAVEDSNIHIRDKEFAVLVGPSGCGKSTTLRMIAGLEEISRGDLFIAGKRVNEVPPKDRDIAMVFQNYALYPHMTVYDNMAFGLKIRKRPKAEIRSRVHEAAETLGLTDLLRRKSKALSGGQRQRVALGRALVRDPKVFLFDEPLSNLDAKLRVRMRAEISSLHSRLQTTMIYVTHDQTEAMTMGNRIILMNQGKIQQIGDPLTLYHKPRNQFAASFIGSPPMNLFQLSVARHNDQYGLQGKSLFWPVSPAAGARLRPYLGRRIPVGVRPEHLQPLHQAENPPEQYTPAPVQFLELLGAETRAHCLIEGQACVVRLFGETNLHIGDSIFCAPQPERMHFFDPETGMSLLHDTPTPNSGSPL